MMVNELSEYLIKKHPQKASHVLAGYSIEDQISYIEEIPTELVAQLLLHLEPFLRIKLFRQLSVVHGVKLLEQLSFQYTTHLMRGLSAGLIEEYLKQLPVKQSASLRILLRYPKYAVGHVMNTKVIAVYSSTTVSEAIIQIKRHSDNTVNTLYIINQDDHPIGYFELSQLLTADDNLKISQCMKKIPVTIPARTSLFVASRYSEWLSHNELPVVDRTGKLLGVLLHHTIRQILWRKKYVLKPDNLIVDTMSSITELLFDSLVSSEPENELTKIKD